MPKKRRALTVDTLWQLQRVGLPALSPDGRRAVCSVATPSMADNTSRSALWLLPATAQAADAPPPRQLTHCGSKDGQPAWSPQGDCIAFIAKREQQGSKDSAPQLYVIAPDGGEARRVSDFAPGIESFKWLPDGKRIVFAAWVWPELQGAKAQARRHKEFSDRKESGYATSAAYYRFWDSNLPLGRVLHLLLLDVASGRTVDLFEGTRYALPLHDGGSGVYDLRPDGRRLVFLHDPAKEPVLANPLAVVELDLRSKTFTTLAQDPAWDFAAPRYSPSSGTTSGSTTGTTSGPTGGAGGTRIALLAAHVGRHHTALQQPALLDPGHPGQPPQLLLPDWDHDVQGPMAWTADGSALLFTSEEAGRCHLWRHALGTATASVVHRGGTVQGFDVAGDTVVLAADSALHPAQLFTLTLGQPAAPARRIDSFNDALLASLALGDVQEIQVTGALGEQVQVWLTFPPGFDADKKHPVLHVIHGGPYAAAGDTFGMRWNAHVFAAPPASHDPGKTGKRGDKKKHRGRVIAQVNFHGSSGFGWAFRHSLIGRQGALELQDIEAATDWLVQQRWVDSSRIAAAGGSYGGFLVAWMNGHVPAWPEGRYRAYVCHAGVFDRVATFSADSYPERPKDLAARYWEDMPHVLAQSPHASAGRMATPTLVTHGAQDFRVPDCNGLAYYNTLKALGIDARLLWFPDENHWVLKPQNAQLWYREFMAWVGKYA